MIRMKSTTEAPPQGWIVEPPLVQGVFRDWSFHQICATVQRLNPHMSPEQISEAVDVQNALRCLRIGADNFVFRDERPGWKIYGGQAPGIPAQRKKLPVTLIAVDTSPKAHLAARAIARCLEQADFAEVKLLTNDLDLPHAVKIDPLNGLAGYSEFCIRELHKHFSTSHVLLVQWDGYVLDGNAWRPDFLEYDYIGAPWLPSRHVGNGGFSLRSKRLLEIASTIPGNPHPEDNFICVQHAASLGRVGMKFPPYQLAERFAFEGRSWNESGREWQGMPTAWAGQFGFHSFLTPLPPAMDRPKVFHHSGDMGDLIYGLATIKALGGGTLFISADNRYPYPIPTRQRATPDWASSIGSLIYQQPYIWQTQWTHATPYSADHDLNEFREYYRTGKFSKTDSLFSLHQKRFGVSHSEVEPWLVVDGAVEEAPIVVNRTARYHNDYFPWSSLVQKHADSMVFVGTPEEHRQFCIESKAPAVRHVSTGNLLELARVISGAKVFIGNQSTPMAIALGLGKNLIQECWDNNPNCLLKRENAIYFQSGSVEIPENWL